MAFGSQELTTCRALTVMKTLRPTMARLAPTLQTLKAPDPDSWRAGKTTAQRGYGGRWQRARLAHLRANPLCVACLPDKVTAANIVDHKIAHRGDYALFWMRSNWQSMCSACHNAKREAEELEAGRIRTLESATRTAVTGSRTR